MHYHATKNQLYCILYCHKNRVVGLHIPISNHKKERFLFVVSSNYTTFATMKSNKTTIRIFIASAVCTAMTMFAACSEKPKSNDIIAKKPVKTAPKPTQNMGDYKQERTIEWLGGHYTINVERKADKSLPLAVDESGNKYYDNRITLTIMRSDGTEFFKRTFSKADFAEYAGDDYNNGALLGIVTDHTDGDNLIFAASVGSPDKMSDNYVPLILKISRLGSISISRDTKLDTTSDDVPVEDTDDEI